jgi:hypothetical protein
MCRILLRSMHHIYYFVKTPLIRTTYYVQLPKCPNKCTVLQHTTKTTTEQKCHENAMELTWSKAYFYSVEHYRPMWTWKLYALSCLISPIHHHTSPEWPKSRLALSHEWDRGHATVSLARSMENQQTEWVITSPSRSPGNYTGPRPSDVPQSPH